MLFIDADMCTIPADVNGVSTPTALSQIGVGTSVTVVCASGFTESGSATRMCLAGSTLDGSASSCGKK
jgi:hypothetical protein